MLPSIVLPITVSILVALVATATHRRLRPTVATWLVTITLGLVAAAAVPTLWLVALGYLAHLPLLGGRLQWCAAAFGVHAPIPMWIGVPALVLTVAGLVRLRRVVGKYRQVRCHHLGGVEIADHARPFAFTLPGRGGHIVLSRGLVDILDETERGIVLAHERAHAANRHDRYLMLAQFAVALVPFLRPLAGRVQFSLERCADEVAVAHCGDRGLVARTLGKVALHGAGPAAAMSFAGLGVSARVAALLSPPATGLRAGANIAVHIAIVMTGALAAFQLHHLAQLVMALCPH